MAKSPFRLETLLTLLRLRQSVRNQRRLALAQAHQAEAILRRQQAELQQQQQALQQHCQKAAQPGPVPVDQLLDARRYEIVLRSQAQQLARQIDAVHAEAERRRQALTEADREVRVLEKLKEKQYQRHREEENRREIKTLDESAARQTRTRPLP